MSQLLAFWFSLVALLRQVLGYEPIQEITLFRSREVTHRATELPWVNMELCVFFEIVSTCCFTVTVRVPKRLRTHEPLWRGELPGAD